MAKTKATGRNIIFIGKDGTVAIAGPTGGLAVVRTDELFQGNITALIKKRQAVGNELVQALAKAHYPVMHEVELDVIDPSGALAKLGKKRKKKP